MPCQALQDARVASDRLCYHLVADLQAAWEPLGYQTEAYAVDPASIFCEETIVDVILFLMAPANLRELNPATVRDAIDASLTAPGDVLPRLLTATGLATPLWAHDASFFGAVVALLRSGLTEWFALLQQHGILTQHTPTSGAPFSHASHWEWCQEVHSDWAQDRARVTAWVMGNIKGTGFGVNQDMQQLRKDRMNELYEHLRRQGQAALDVMIGAADLDTCPAHLRVYIEEYLALYNGEPWQPPNAPPSSAQHRGQTLPGPPPQQTNQGNNNNNNINSNNPFRTQANPGPPAQPQPQPQPQPLPNPEFRTSSQQHQHHQQQQQQTGQQQQTSSHSASAEVQAILQRRAQRAAESKYKYQLWADEVTRASMQTFVASMTTGNITLAQSQESPEQ